MERKYTPSFNHFHHRPIVHGAHRWRARKTNIAAATIQQPQRLSTETALKLFSPKVAPVACYETQVIWEKLISRDLVAIYRVKAAFLKWVLGLYVLTRNSLVHLLLETPSFVEKILRTLVLAQTVSTAFLLTPIKRSWEKSRDPSLLVTPAMANASWKITSRSNH